MLVSSLNFGMAVPWVAEGSVTVAQQALRDFHQAWRTSSQARPQTHVWSAQGVHEGFRIVASSPATSSVSNRPGGGVPDPLSRW